MEKRFAILRLLSIALVAGTASCPVFAQPSAEAQAVRQISSIMAQERSVLGSITADRLMELGGQARAVPRDPAINTSSAPQPLMAMSVVTNEQTRLSTAHSESVAMLDDMGVAAPLSVEQIDALPRADGGAEWDCLTQALYFEARGESISGQMAVAEVILNRVDDRRYPRTICGVIRQGEERRHRCQFSYMCDGKLETVTDGVAWRRMGKIARLMLDGRPRFLTDGATHYHATHVEPFWASRLVQTVWIGRHKFYRYPTQLVQN